ncbi:MAG: ATP-binding protein [Lentimicrobium sp.]|nr:ATP-binding protein [Lentimicrobium sp.]
MIRNILAQQREERDALLQQKYIQRMDDEAIAEYLNTSLIKLITGPRRAGKSVMALQILKNKNFAYLNFDDDLLLNNFEEDIVIQSLNDVYAGYTCLLLDEIQNLPNWELWVGKLYRRGINLIITGSNSRLLSNEMASALTGRYLQIIVLPFSFGETLRFKSFTVSDKMQYTPAGIGEILALLDSYMFNGGFPETLFNPLLLKNYLSSLFDSVLLKDILKRFRIRNTRQLYDLSNFLLSNYTNPFSYNHIKDSLNFNSVATVQKFLGYLEEPYLFMHLTRYNNKVINQQKSAQKIYVIDNGFIKARSFELSPNYGRLLENLVFIELLRRGYRPGLDLFYYRTRNDKEIDFLIRKGHQIEQLIQVCYNFEQLKVIKRETNALTEAAKELNCTNLLILSWDKEDIIEMDDLKIKLLPAWKWLLSK